MVFTLHSLIDREMNATEVLIKTMNGLNWSPPFRFQVIEIARVIVNARLYTAIFLLKNNTYQIRRKTI